MRHVYRRPFDHAQHEAASVQWQPELAWNIDCSVAQQYYSTYAAAIGLEPTIVCSADTMAYTAHKAVISGDISVSVTLATMGYTTYRAGTGIYRIIECNAASETMTGLVVPITATRLHIPVRSMGARSTGNKITARDARQTMSARDTRNRIKVA